METFTTIAQTHEVQPGTGLVVEHNDRTIALFNIDGEYFAIDNTCIHRGGPLGEGELEGDCVSCPWHGWQFNVKTGACLTSPAAKVRSYQVKVEEEAIQINLDSSQP